MNALPGWVRESTRQQYKPDIRIGNWVEDTIQAKERSKDFQWLRDNDCLPDQIIQRKLSDFLVEIPFEKTGDELVRFGDKINVLAMAWSSKNIDRKWALSLSCTLEALISRTRNGPQIYLTVAPMEKICARNTFRIASADTTNRFGETLNYNQDFQLEVYDLKAIGEPQVVYSSTKAINGLNVPFSPYSFYRRGEINLSVGLENRQNIGLNRMRWRCLSRIPNNRFDTNGTPINDNTDLIIVHQSTNRCLAAEHSMNHSPFGLERGVSATTIKDVYGVETMENVWKIQIVKHA